ncbi:MAG: sodium:solute symporter [Planctomycetia bacterium]|nr:sodium:solute symporter [Planctomycetia bacterium]
MPDAVPEAGWGLPTVLVIVIVASVYLGTLAQRAMAKSGFLKGFFLGNRGLGVWAMALTATVQSGGTFMGVPSYIYTYGWIVALWIGSYMLVPLTGFGILGKRIAQLSRRTGAVTVPELFRRRFDSPALGIVASTFILIFLSFLFIAQFKAGAIVMKIAIPNSGALALAEELPAASDVALLSLWDSLDKKYLFGLVIFACTVVGYTLIGGFLASVWTDLFQSVLMWFGVLILLGLTLYHVGGLENATRTAIENTGPGYAYGPGYGAVNPETGQAREFLPVSLAVSMFVIWIFGGVATPAGLVRLMASKDTATLRRSVLVLSLYNCCIYIPLIVICIAARGIMPDLDKSDEVIPRMALMMTQDFAGGSLVAGLILAAPFGAIMATVSTFLIVISSGIVHDIYQQVFHPHADEKHLKRLTRIVMIVVGMIAVLANIKPIDYLQALIVFCTSGAAATFLAPALLAAYWRRANAAGAIAAMVTGASVVLVLFLVGQFTPDPNFGPTSMRPYYLFGLDPVVWGIPGSLLAGVAVSLFTPPPSPELVARMFDRLPATK